MTNMDNNSEYIEDEADLLKEILNQISLKHSAIFLFTNNLCDTNVFDFNTMIGTIFDESGNGYNYGEDIDNLFKILENEYQIGILINWSESKITFYPDYNIPCQIILEKLNETINLRIDSLLDCKNKTYSSSEWKIGDLLVCVDGKFNQEGNNFKLPNKAQICRVERPYQGGIILKGFRKHISSNSTTPRAGFANRRFIVLKDYMKSLSLIDLCLFRENNLLPWLNGFKNHKK